MGWCRSDAMGWWRRVLVEEVLKVRMLRDGWRYEKKYELELGSCECWRWRLSVVEEWEVVVWEW